MNETRESITIQKFDNTPNCNNRIYNEDIMGQTLKNKLMLIEEIKVYDTLKEIIDWIYEHPDDFSEIENDIEDEDIKK